VPFNKLLECGRIAPTHQPHESHVLSIFLRSPLIFWIVATHRSLRRLHRMEVAKKMASSEKLALLPHSPPWFLLQA